MPRQARDLMPQAAEIDAKIAPNRPRVRPKESRQQDAIHRSHRRLASGAIQQRASRVEMGRGVVGNIERTGQGARPGKRPHAAQKCRDVTIELQRIRPDPLPGSADFPGIAQEAAAELLAPRHAPEHDHLAGQQPAAGFDMKLGRAPQPAAIEQDGLVRQEFEPRPALRGQRHIHPTILAQRAVDLFGGLGGHGRPGALLHGDVDPDPVAASQPATGGEQNSIRRFPRFGPRKQGPAGRALIKVRKPGTRRRRRKHQFGGAVAALQGRRRADKGLIVRHVKR
jgi:hypothetical protein